MGGMSQRILSISHRECTRGGKSCPPPSTFSMGNGQNSMVRNSGAQQAIVIKLEISSKYLIQYILGENPGNPTMLIISEQEVTSDGKWSIGTTQTHNKF